MSIFTTWTGAKIDFTNLKDYKPDILDVAHSLSLLCRYRGQIPYHYSVAQHSLLVERILQEEGYSPFSRMSGLLHDGPEMLISDCPSPLKKVLPEFIKMEERIGDIFDNHFCTNSDLIEVHDADKNALENETYFLFYTKGDNLTFYSFASDYVQPEEPKITEQKFLAKYWELKYLLCKETFESINT